MSTLLPPLDRVTRNCHSPTGPVTAPYIGVVSLTDGPDGRDLIDWDLALATAKRLQSPGPQLPEAQARAVCDQLRELAEIATAHVQSVTRLEPAADPGEVAVLDRASWAASTPAKGRRAENFSPRTSSRATPS